MKISKLSLFILLILCAFGNAYAQINNSASRAAEQFLKSTMIMDLEEGKQIFSKTIWGDIGGMSHVPNVIDYSKIHESMFKTDVLGILGYRQLVLVKILTEENIVLTKKYLLIAYAETISREWKVYAFLWNTDISHAIDTAARRISSGDDFLKPRYLYRQYGVLLAADGKLDEARSVFIKAADLNKANPKQYDHKNPQRCRTYSQESFDIHVDIVNKIIGNR